MLHVYYPFSILSNCFPGMILPTHPFSNVSSCPFVDFGQPFDGLSYPFLDFGQPFSISS